MQEKSISGKRINKSITSEDILGKDVIDAEGGFIGVAEKIFIDPEPMDFIGISVDKGLIRSGLTIGKNYIDAEGGFIGVAEKIFIDPEPMDFIGISVDKGLIRSGLTIGKNY